MGAVHAALLINHASSITHIALTWRHLAHDASVGMLPNLLVALQVTYMRDAGSVKGPYVIKKAKSPICLVEQ